MLSLFCICAMAFGATESVLRWSYIDSITGNLEISENGMATVSASSSCDEATSMTVIASLQQYKDGKWKEIKQWSKSDNTKFVATGGDWPVYHGYEYQLVITSKGLY